MEPGYLGWDCLMLTVLCYENTALMRPTRSAETDVNGNDSPNVTKASDVPGARHAARITSFNYNNNLVKKL